MSDLATRVENLSKLYHIVLQRSLRIAQKRHDTLRDAMGSWRLEIGDWMRRLAHPTLRLRSGQASNLQYPTSNDTIWALRDVSFEACPEQRRRIKRGEVVGIPSSFDFSQDAQDKHWAQRAGKSTLTSTEFILSAIEVLGTWLKILSRITEPTQGRAIIDGRVDVKMISYIVDWLHDQKKSLYIIATVVICILSGATYLVYGPLTIDDAFITFKYVSNILSGNGFVFNLGEHILGTTTPLFTLLLVVTEKCSQFSIAQSALVLNVAGVCLGVICLVRLFSNLGQSFVGIIAAALYAFHPSVLQFTTSGMETSCYIGLILAALTLYAENRKIGAAAVSGLVLLIRPDGILVAVLLFLHWALTQRTDFLKGILAFLAVLFPWLMFATLYFGNPIPNSVLAKMVAYAPLGFVKK